MPASDAEARAGEMRPDERPVFSLFCDVRPVMIEPTQETGIGFLHWCGLGIPYLPLATRAAPRPLLASSKLAAMSRPRVSIARPETRPRHDSPPSEPASAPPPRATFLAPFGFPDASGNKGTRRSSVSSSSVHTVAAAARPPAAASVTAVARSHTATRVAHERGGRKPCRTQRHAVSARRRPRRRYGQRAAAHATAARRRHLGAGRTRRRHHSAVSTSVATSWITERARAAGSRPLETRGRCGLTPRSSRGGGVRPPRLHGGARAQRARRRRHTAKRAIARFVRSLRGFRSFALARATCRTGRVGSTHSCPGTRWNVFGSNARPERPAALRRRRARRLRPGAAPPTPPRRRRRQVGARHLLQSSDSRAPRNAISFASRRRRRTSRRGLARLARRRPSCARQTRQGRRGVRRRARITAPPRARPGRRCAIDITGGAPSWSTNAPARAPRSRRREGALARRRPARATGRVRPEVLRGPCVAAEQDLAPVHSAELRAERARRHAADVHHVRAFGERKRRGDASALRRRRRRSCGIVVFAPCKNAFIGSRDGCGRVRRVPERFPRGGTGLKKRRDRALRHVCQLATSRAVAGATE